MRHAFGLHAHEVGHHQPLAPEQSAHVLVELARAQRWRDTVAVEGVDQHDIGPIVALRDVSRGLRPHHAEARIVGRQMELPAKGDDVRVDLDHRDPRRGKMAMAVLRERPAAQPEHEDLARVGQEEEEAHHLAGVGELERVRVRQAHLALDEGAREVQAACAVVLDHEGLVVQAGKHAIDDRLAVAILRLEEPDHAAFAAERVGQLEHHAFRRHVSFASR